MTLYEEPTSSSSDFLEVLTERNAIARAFWTGLYSGLYGMSGKVDRPDENCFGAWIPEHMQQLSMFREHLHEGVFNIDMDEMAVSAYNAVDLFFLNERYCHFFQPYHDVSLYCQESMGCGVGSLIENAQKNAFNMITQVSSAAGLFKQQAWSEMDTDAKVYAVNSFSHSIAGLYADMIGFDASKIVKA